METKRDYVTDLPFWCLRMVGQDLNGNHVLNFCFITLVMSVALVLSFMELILHNEGPKTWAGTFEVFTVGVQVNFLKIFFWVFKLSIYTDYAQTYNVSIQ